MNQDGRGFAPGQVRMLWVLWATYGAFYFCRTNVSAAVAAGMPAELELTATQMGIILSALKLTYGVGQFINGQLAERLSARVLLAIGMFGSAALNVAFGVGTGFYFLLFVWATNGYAQSLGWTPCMKVASRWFSSAERGRAIGLIGTGYLLAGAATFLVAGWAADWFGWRGAHLVPAALLAAVGLFTLFALDESGGAGEGTGEGAGDDEAAAEPYPGWRRTLVELLTNPRLWLVALALAFVDACRYGFLDWGIAHIREVQGGNVGTAALKYAVLPLGGMIGAVSAGYLSDRLAGGRRAPILFGFLVVLGCAALAYDALIQVSLVASIVLLALIGFCVYGPQVMLVGSTAMDVSRGHPAAAVGFVNLFGYLGASAADIVTGALRDAYGWQVVVYFWAGCGFAAAVIILPLWGFSAARQADRS